MLIAKTLRRAGVFIVASAVAATAAAQTVTTGSISGTVTDPQDAGIPGATVVAVHTPTGTNYESTTGLDGRYQILNARVGGPYRLTVNMPGFREETQTDVVVALGADTSIDFDLELATVAEQVTVTAEAPAIDTMRAGTASNVQTDAIERLPTVARSLTDFARLDPNFVTTSTGSGATVLSVAGRNNRYNNIQIDGAINNDLFAISDASAPGGASETQPISLDAIEELQLVVSPYDVRQGGFTGGGINAVTRSGSNRVGGTAYYFGRQEALVGKISDRGVEIPLGPFSDQQAGGSFSGPIAQNRAFFFVNYELSRRDTPSGFSIGQTGQNWGHAEDAERFLAILQNRYGYDPSNGGDPLREFVRTTNSDKLFIRTDFNLSNSHRLTVRHNFIDAMNDVGFPSNTLYYFPDNFYRIANNQNSTVAQLNSTFGQSFNELRVTYQRIRDRRTTPGAFPFVRVFLADGSSMRAGTENFSSRNALDQDIIEITNDYTRVFGEHTVTVGTHNEFFGFDNLFIRDNFGNYTFSSLELFEQGLAQSFDYSFSVTDDPLESANFSVRQFGFYAGDQWRVNNQLTVTYGLRVDVPVFPDTPTRNPFAETTFGYRTDVVPESRLWSPRVGVNYDLHGDGRAQVRGGFGLFTGRTPYVWLSNQYGNTGNEFQRIQISNRSTNRIPFVSDPLNQPSTVPGAQVIGNEIDLIDPDYDFPSLWRGNIGYDRQLGFGGLVLSTEFLASRTVKDVRYANLSLRQTGTRPFDNRPVYDSAAGGRIANVNAIFLTNTDQGHQWNWNLKLEKPFREGWFASGSYAYGQTRSVLDARSSQAASNWGNARTPGNPNDLPLARSDFDVGHRVSLAASYIFNLPRGFNVTTSMFYNGQSGRPYSVTYNNTDVNLDSQSFNDLLWVPNSANDVVLRGGTAEQLEAFIDEDDCLSDSRGRIVERNCGRQPFTNIVDVKFAVGLPAMRRARVELTMDVLNFLNLLNSEWGRYEFLDFQTLNALRYEGIDAASGKPIYNIASFASPTFRKFTIDNLRSRWQAQFGARVRF
jgi:outer membrane receptor protein involved in Fe transport